MLGEKTVVALHLKLDNINNLPDGGPTSLDVQGRRSVDIGRNTYLDWTLPDPARVVSGRHCEIHFRDGGYWITDISTNGTFLNGSDTRLTEPTRLRSGDRIAIGDYLIKVTVEEDGDGPSRTVEAPPAGPAELSSGALWDVADERAAPAERASEKKARVAKPVHADVLDWISDLPTPEPVAAAGRKAEPAQWADEDETAEPADETEAEPADDAEPAREAWQAGADDGAAEETATVEAAPMAEAPEPVEPVEADEVATAMPDDEAPFAPEPAAEEDAAPAAAGDEDDAWRVPPEAVAEAQDEAQDKPEFSPAVPPMAGDAGFGPAVRASEPAPVRHGEEFERFVVALAAALDVPRERVDARSPEELAQRVGAFVSLSIAGMQKLLKARATSRGYMRAGPGTQVQAIGNNPLKFMPTPGAAADVLFGPPSRSYLGIEETMDESFADLGTHQMALYAAMQGAVERMLKDLDPAAIEAGGGEEKGFALPGSRKAKQWDTYKERYTARASQHDNGMVDVFMMCFADAYDRAINHRD